MGKIRVADYIANRIVSHGIKDVFMVTGGGAMHLNDALGNHPDLSYYCNHHEQASAIAAEGYFRASGKLPLVNVTTGPGGTNAITGVLGQWLDSIPAIYISGQVKYETTIHNYPEIEGLRQLGDQEADIIKIVSPITKYSKLVTDPLSIKKEIDKAIYIATNGRPGPVWLDIPLNVQGAVIETELLEEYDHCEDQISFNISLLEEQVDLLIDKLTHSKSPALYIGNGIRLANAVCKFEALTSVLNIPILNGISGHDLTESDHPLFLGRPGICGDRIGNIVVQNVDLLIVIGTRVGLRQATYNYPDFARKAYKVMIDIDAAELNKPTLNIDLRIHADISLFLDTFLQRIQSLRMPTFDQWISWCQQLKSQLPSTMNDNSTNPEFVNSYVFVDELFKILPNDSVVVTGNGTAYTCTFQAMHIKKGMRVFANQGCASMGYCLPAAIGASIANDKKDVILITGDGSIMMNLQELQTITSYNLPIKVFILENEGYAAIRTTQKSFFSQRFVGESPSSGVGFPDFSKIANAFGFAYHKIRNENMLEEQLKNVLQIEGPVICEVKMDPNQTLYPKVGTIRLPDGKLASQPIEWMQPQLKESINVVYSDYINSPLSSNNVELKWTV